MRYCKIQRFDGECVLVQDISPLDIVITSTQTEIIPDAKLVKHFRYYARKQHRRSDTKMSWYNELWLIWAKGNEMTRQRVIGLYKQLSNRNTPRTPTDFYLQPTDDK